MAGFLCFKISGSRCLFECVFTLVNTWLVLVFSISLRTYETRQEVRNDNKIVSILDVSHESSSDISSSDSDCEISDADTSDSGNGTSDCVSVTEATEVSD
jgi:hypothetical protein